MAGSRTQVTFTVLEVLKGEFQRADLRFNGHLELEDDANDRPVPRDSVRPGGRMGNCFALGYRQGGEYLLFLRRARHRAYAQAMQLTPYWAPLAATNDQLFGPTDPWLTWVRRMLMELRGKDGRVPHMRLHPTAAAFTCEVRRCDSDVQLIRGRRG